MEPRQVNSNIARTINSPDFNNMSAEEAYIRAGNENYNVNGRYNDDLASVIVRENNPTYAFYWAKKFQSHYSQMAEVIANAEDIWFAYDWIEKISIADFHQKMFESVSNKYLADTKGYCTIMSNWFVRRRFDRLVIKQDVVKHEGVGEFVKHLNNVYNDDYSLENFYSDLPSSAQMNVIL